MNFITSENDFKKLIDKEVVIYGAGQYGRDFFDMFAYNQARIIAFIDNCSTEPYRNIKTVKPQQMFKEKPLAVYVIASVAYYRDMYSDCVGNGIPEENIFVSFPAQVMMYEIDNVKYGIGKIKDGLLKMTPRPIIGFETHLVDHCNLNCKGCDHFSSISDKWYANIESYKRDMCRMSEVFGGEADRILLIGGEPLLHPDIIDFMRVARDNFPKANVSICTNGLLLPKMNEKFWSTCRELDVKLSVTEYPVSFDYEATAEKAAYYNVGYISSKDRYTVKTLYKPVLDLSGGCDARKSFIACHQANNCIALLEGGNVYTCPVAAHIEIFNKRFNLDIGGSPRDYINIHTETTAEKILEFLAKPIPMCRYCDILKREVNLEWETSSGSISEWTI